MKNSAFYASTLETWAPGLMLNFTGSQKTRYGNGKTLIRGEKYVAEIAEVFDHSPNLRHLTARCPIVWSSAIRVFADKTFRPTVMDKDSLTATFAYDGGRVDSGATTFLKAYTTAKTGFGFIWDSFRFDAASLYLREEKSGGCTAELKMSFAAFGKQMFGGEYGWYAVNSNFNFEKGILDELETQAKKATDTDLVL